MDISVIQNMTNIAVSVLHKWVIRIIHTYLTTCKKLNTVHCAVNTVKVSYRQPPERAAENIAIKEKKKICIQTSICLST